MASKDEVMLLDEMIAATDVNNERRHLAALTSFAKAANVENAVLVHKAHFFGLAPTHGADGRPLRRMHFIDPANTELLLALYAGAWKDKSTFTYSTFYAAQLLRFEATFVDRSDYKVVCSTPPGVLLALPRGKAFFSLLADRTFAGVEAFVVAVENALGGDVDTVTLAGKIDTLSDV